MKAVSALENSSVLLVKLEYLLSLLINGIFSSNSIDLAASITPVAA